MSSDSESPFTEPAVSQVWHSLFENTYTDRSIKALYYRTFLDQYGSAGLNSNHRRRFKVDSTNNFLVPALGYMRLALKITNSNGTPIDNTDDVTIVGNVQHLFSLARFSFMNTAVEQKNLPGFESHIKNLIELPTPMLRSYGQLMGFIPDTGAGANDDKIAISTVEEDPAGTFTVTSKENFDYNRGYAVRKRMTAGSQIVEFCIPLSKFFDFFDSNTIPITGAELYFDFEIDEPSRNRFIMNYNANKTYDVSLEHMALHIPHFEASPETEADILRKQDKGEMTRLIYPYYTLATSQEFKQNETHIPWDIATIRTPPTDVTLVFVPRKALNDSAAVLQRSNPCLFPNAQITSARLYVGDTILPREPSVINFSDATRGFGQIYQDLINSQHSSHSKSDSTDTIVSYEDFKRLTTIFHWDLSTIDVSGFDRTASHILRVDFTSTGLDQPYVCLALFGRERTVHVNMTGDRKIILDFDSQS